MAVMRVVAARGSQLWIRAFGFQDKLSLVPSFLNFFDLWDLSNLWNERAWWLDLVAYTRTLRFLVT